MKVPFSRPSGLRTFSQMGWIAAFLLTLPTSSHAQQIAVLEYAVPSPNSAPTSIAAGPDGALWFTEYGANKIGRVTSAGTVTEYPIPTAGSGPSGIAAGADGALWFTEREGNRIGRITTTGMVTEYLTPTPVSGPLGITAGPDGALWFTENASSQIGRITTAAAITEYPIPTAEADPAAITTGPAGTVWFTEAFGNKIGQITLAGTITEYPIPTAASDPLGITLGPDGALWFTEWNGQKIGRIDTFGVITEYGFTITATPYGIALGPDGALWCTISNANLLGRITSDGMTTWDYPIPTSNSDSISITAGPDGALWFTEALGNKIGEALFVTAALSVSPTSGAYRTDLTFVGSSFSPNERVNVYASGIGSPVLATAVADSNGSFQATAREPQSPYGYRTFVAEGRQSGKLGALNFYFSVTARLIMNPTSGMVGSTIAAQGFGFAAGETVKVYWNNPRKFLGTTTSNSEGSFLGSTAVTFSVPSGSTQGPNRVFGVGQSSGAVGAGSVQVQ